MIIDQSVKRCSKCRTSKAPDCFGSNRRTPDGLARWCKGCLNENGRKYHAANREAVLARLRRWHNDNPPHREIMAERTRKWRAANPERARDLRKNGKILRRARTGGGITATQLRAWIDGQPKACHWCGVECERYDIDHLIPLAKGGEHQAHNLVLSCPACNRKKGARCPVEFALAMRKSA